MSQIHLREILLLYPAILPELETYNAQHATFKLTRPSKGYYILTLQKDKGCDVMTETSSFCAYSLYPFYSNVIHTRRTFHVTSYKFKLHIICCSFRYNEIL
jgi:hypothetical protein